MIVADFRDYVKVCALKRCRQELKSGIRSISKTNICGLMAVLGGKMYVSQGLRKPLRGSFLYCVS